LVILGIDPGARAAGYGLLEGEAASWRHLASGVIRPPAGSPLATRLAALDRALREVIERHRPDEVAVESLFHSKNARSAIVMGHARGVILVAARSASAAVAEYAPLEIKMAVTGYGAASKVQVREMVRRLVGAPDRLTLDAADALAVALCHAHRRTSPLAVAQRAGAAQRTLRAQRSGRGQRTLRAGIGTR
jgi:crossover junction endodeoxyribonuclease RuvC